MTEPSTAWREIVPEGEAARLEALAEQLRELQRRTSQKTGRPGRALHRKQHLGVEATLEIASDLPPHARHGLFAKPGQYRCYARFSNGAGRRQGDGAPDVRALAIKVLGVGGKKVIPGLEDATTQDFLHNHTPVSPFKTADEFVAFVLAAAGGPLLLLPRFARKVGFGRAITLIRAILSGNQPFPSYAGRRLYGMLPIRFGPYAVRTALLPVGDPQPGRGRGEDALAEDLALRLKEGPLAWDLAAQFFVDEARTPIEDASVDWKESDAPFVRLARLELPRQDVTSEHGRQVSELVETLSFDPWHALVEHRPLGHLMRARNHAYRLSTQERGAAPEEHIPADR